jgi:hypothetical protein
VTNPTVRREEAGRKSNVRWWAGVSVVVIATLGLYSTERSFGDQALTTVPTTAPAAGAEGDGVSPGGDGATVDTSGAAVLDRGSPLTPRLQELAGVDGDVRVAAAATKAALAASPFSVPSDGPGSLMERDGGRYLVDIRLTDTTEGVLDRLRGAGAVIVYVENSVKVVTAEVAPDRFTAIAAIPEVISVAEVLEPAYSAVCPTGIVSEGNSQLKAGLAKTNFGVDGSGVVVGVLSDSYNRLGGAAADIANGELPGAGNPCGNLTPVSNVEGPSGNDEGRAMAQIVHDLAPKAELRHATAFNGEADFANQIRTLAANGADVITDDITYFAEPMYQDGLIGAAVEDVVAAGVPYFSSARNANKIWAGKNVGSYETQAFRPAPCPATVIAVDPQYNSCHRFNPTGSTPDVTYGVQVGGTNSFILGWNEPQFGVATDLDLYVLFNGNIIDSSRNVNSTTGMPFEFVGISGSGAIEIVVARYGASTGTPRFTFKSGNSGTLSNLEYSTNAGGDVFGPTIFGHNASRGGFSVAAVPYNNANALESFSSHGPATYCWNRVNGSTPAAPLVPCQTATVDISATDGTANSFFGSLVGGTWRFYGTSAAAPHAAAVAALLLDHRPCLTVAQVYAAMQSTAVPVGSFGVDAAGAGLIDANAALAAAPSCGTPPTTTTTTAPTTTTTSTTVPATTTTTTTTTTAPTSTTTTTTEPPATTVPPATTTSTSSTTLPPTTTTTTSSTTVAPTTTTTTTTSTSLPPGPVFTGRDRLYAASVVPPSSISIGSTYAVETAQRVDFTCSGVVHGIWWYRTVADSGTNTVNLWRGPTLAATAKVVVGAVPGSVGSNSWEYLAFASPVPVSAGEQLLASVHHPNGAYGYRLNGFTGRSVTSASGCMRSPASTPSAKNGFYQYSPTPVRPTLSYADSEYFVSPDFEQTSTGPTTTGPTTTTSTTTVVPAVAERLYTNAQVPPSSISIGSAYAVTTAQRIDISCRGSISGIWWYRTAADTGANVVALWKGSAMLAQATVSSTSTGWVFVPFSSPVQVAIGDRLLAGVHHPNGAYGYTLDGFANRSVSSPSGCMTSPPTNSGAPNGLYTYSANPVYPTLSYRATEYWITPQFTKAP